MSRTVFKIFRLAEWRDFTEAGEFSGSPNDVRDGFIHLSLAEQVEATLEKHFTKETDIVLAAFEVDRLGATLKYERSRGGELFPHLYSKLTKNGLNAWARITRRQAGFELPDWCRPDV